MRFVCRVAVMRAEEGHADGRTPGLVAVIALATVGRVRISLVHSASGEEGAFCARRCISDIIYCCASEEGSVRSQQQLFPQQQPFPRAPIHLRQLHLTSLGSP